MPSGSRGGGRPGEGDANVLLVLIAVGPRHGPTKSRDGGARASPLEGEPLDQGWDGRRRGEGRYGGCASSSRIGGGGTHLHTTINLIAGKSQV